MAKHIRFNNNTQQRLLVSLSTFNFVCGINLLFFLLINKQKKNVIITHCNTC